ncbi:MAG: outer membrane protein assembly factor BamB [Pseudomonadota bacterium]
MNGARLLRTCALTALAVLAAACSSDSKRADKPAKLTDFQSSAKVERLWRTSVGDSALKLRVGLSLATDGKAVFVANHDGKVFAYNPANGKQLWSTSTKLALTGGPGVGEGLVVAGGSHGNVVALDAATGAVKWKSYINSEILAAPAIARQVVVVRTVDGRVVALRAGDGTQMWSAEQQVPRLSLRGTARPIIVNDLVLCGFDNGRLMALQLNDGSSVWEASISPSAGRTELERLNDVDTQLQVQGNEVYVVNFHGKAARLDLETGQVQWSRDISSYSGLSLDADAVYLTSDDGSVQKLTNRSGVEMWKQVALSHRRLSAPALLGDVVVVGDLDGYIHFLDRGTGALAARTHDLSDRVSAQPLVVGDTVFILDASGHLVALRAKSVPVAAGKAKAAPTIETRIDPSGARKLPTPVTKPE